MYMTFSSFMKLLKAMLYVGQFFLQLATQSLREKLLQVALGVLDTRNFLQWIGLIAREIILIVSGLPLNKRNKTETCCEQKMAAFGDEDTPFVFLRILSDDDFEIKSKYYSFIIVSSCFDSYLGFSGSHYSSEYVSFYMFSSCRLVLLFLRTKNLFRVRIVMRAVIGSFS